uniref:AP2/ERF domain-containing protein n=1 Tax=Aureoumbra lagunensis TaxID=44058 RepID=A0A7S3K0A7_9STRA
MNPAFGGPPALLTQRITEAPSPELRPEDVIDDDEILEFELPRGASLKLASRVISHDRKRSSAAVLTPPTQVALARAGGAFVLYVTAAAVAICRESKRQTVSALDVDTALRNLNYENWIPACHAHLEYDKAHRPKHAPTLKKYRGVYQGSINAWYSQISIAGQPIHLGSFAAPEDAARAYDRAIWSKLGTAALELLNFPQDIPDAAKYLQKPNQRSDDEGVN